MRNFFLILFISLLSLAAAGACKTAVFFYSLLFCYLQEGTDYDLIFSLNCSSYDTVCKMHVVQEY